MFRLSNRSVILVASVLAALTLTGQSQAQSTEPFYKGKTITIYVGFSAGGSYDLFARIFARHWAKYVPGNPTMVASNMPGAGSLTAANWLYKVAPRDGTGLGIVTQTIAIEEVLKTAGVQYKASDFNWIGRATSNVEVLVLANKTGNVTLETAKQVSIPVASTGLGSPSDSYPRLLNDTIGTKFRVIRGFPGSNDGIIALERGEVDGTQTSWNSIKSQKMQMLRDKKIVIPLQYTLRRAPELADVPTPVDIMTNDHDRRMFSFALSSAEVGRSFFAPPGVPAQRVADLRSSFVEALKDPDLRAEIEKANLDFEPMPGDELAKIIAQAADVDAKLAERIQRLNNPD